MGSGTLCAGCNLREENPAPRGRELHAGSTRGAAWVQAQPALPRVYHFPEMELEI